MTDSRVEQLVWTTHSEATDEAQAEYDGKATPAQIWELVAYKLATHYMALTANHSPPAIHSGVPHGFKSIDETQH